MEPLAGAATAGSPYKGDLQAAAERQRKWWPARVTRPVLRIKSPLHHFNACRPEDGARGRTRTCTGDALDVVSLLLDYASAVSTLRSDRASRQCAIERCG